MAIAAPSGALSAFFMAIQANRMTPVFAERCQGTNSFAVTCRTTHALAVNFMVERDVAILAFQRD